MSIKKANPKKYGQRYCSYGECKDNKVPSKWHCFWARAGTDACDEHKDQLVEQQDDGYMSEADHQTWGKL